MVDLPRHAPDARREEYERVLAEFVVLQEAVVAHEVATFEVQSALHAFECYYLGRVQHLHALLDALHVETLELWLARVRVRDAARAETYADLLVDARARARESAAAIPCEAPETYDPAPPDADTKRLYRRVARQVHPDLAENKAQAALRHAFMAELNAAYKAGDVGRMQAVQDAWHAASVAPEEDLDASIARLGRQSERARRRLGELERTLQTLRGSDLHALMLRAREGQAQGHDVLQQIVEDLERQIEEARLDLAAQREEVAA